MNDYFKSTKKGECHKINRRGLRICRKQWVNSNQNQKDGRSKASPTLDTPINFIISIVDFFFLIFSPPHKNIIRARVQKKMLLFA